MAKKRKGADSMIDGIRGVIEDYEDLPEREMYEALLLEASGWQVRLQELKEAKKEGA